MDSREVLRCEHCKLVQFMTANGNCRKPGCRKPLKEPEPEPVEIAAIAQTAREYTGSRMFDTGTAVWLLRTSFGWSQPELARKCGVPRTYISKVEGYKAVPTVSSLVRFAEAFGIPTAALVEIAHHVRNGRAA